MDELIERIYTAIDKMWEEKLTANTVVLNGKKYGCLFELGFTPSICGLTAELGNLPDNIDFIVQHRYPEPEPATNGDRIRSMTDEELADWVWGAETAGRAYGPRGKKAWLDWLREVGE